MEIGPLKVKEGDILTPKFDVNREELNPTIIGKSDNTEFQAQPINILDQIVGTRVRVTDTGQDYNGNPLSAYATVKIIEITDTARREEGSGFGEVGTEIQIPAHFLLKKILKWYKEHHKGSNP